MKNNLTLWRDNPFAPLMDLQRDIDRLFGDYLSPSHEGSRTGSSGWFNPACDIEETDQHFLVNMDVPGMRKEDIRIELQDGQLVVSGTRSHESKQEDKGMRRVERSFGQFQRSFSVPAGVDPERIEANYENGVLTLAIPKAETAKPRQIRIGENKGFLGKLLGSGKDSKATESEKKTA